MSDDGDFDEGLFFPFKDVSQAPAGAVDLIVPVGGAALHLRWHRDARARATVLLFHGNGEVVADYDASAPLFARAGASLAVVDYRGYGRSSGTPSLRAIIEDAPSVMRALVSERPGPLFVMGRSLGSACAAELYGAIPEEVAGFILESGFVDLEAAAARRGRSANALTPRDRAGFDPIPKLERGRTPLLVLHGALDDLIPPAEAEAAFAHAGTKRKTLVVLEGRGHNDIADSPEYWTAIRQFVEAMSPEKGS